MGEAGEEEPYASQSIISALTGLGVSSLAGIVGMRYQARISRHQGATQGFLTLGSLFLICQKFVCITVIVSPLPTVWGESPSVLGVLFVAEHTPPPLYPQC